MTKKYDLIVVGGGASGMMAAGRAGERGLSVLLLEKNKQLGNKLSISGNGRCNILNAIEDQHMLLEKYGSSKPFLYSLFAQFGEKEAFDFFNSRGLPLVVEGYNRVFPKSQSALDVVQFLIDYMNHSAVDPSTGKPRDASWYSSNELATLLPYDQGGRYDTSKDAVTGEYQPVRDVSSALNQWMANYQSSQKTKPEQAQPTTTPSGQPVDIASQIQAAIAAAQAQAQAQAKGG